MSRRERAALLALVFLVAACASVACVGAHIGHCCKGPACETCPVLLSYLRVFADALVLAALLTALGPEKARTALLRAPRRAFVPRTPVRDRVELND